MPRQDHDDLNGNPATKRDPAYESGQARIAARNAEIDRRYAAGLAETERKEAERKAAKNRPRSAVGEALHVHGEAVDHVEALYLQHAGEVTDETEAAEARRDVSARDAAEHVARYIRWLDDQEAAVERERNRLDDVAARLANRRTWAEGHAVELLEAIAPGRSKATVGTHTIMVRRTTAVEIGERFDVQALPAAWTREIAEVPAVPARPALDKNAAKADLLLGYREGEPPCDGWYDIEGRGRALLSRDDEAGCWRIAPQGVDWDETLEASGLSIEPEPGLDVLRWKPSPPGVALVRRAHVKVG
jgi:hypothetical protein